MRASTSPKSTRVFRPGRVAALALLAVSACAPSDRHGAGPGQSAQAFSLGPSSTVAPNVLSAEAVATNSGYALAYVAQGVTGSNEPTFTARIAFLDETGAIVDGPQDLQSTPYDPIHTLGVAWNGTQALVVIHQEEPPFSNHITGYLVAPGSAPSPAFSRAKRS